jgi:hypothetical protein
MPTDNNSRVRGDAPTGRVDTILARFPGPVTLYMSRLKRLLMVVIGAPVAVLCAWILFAGHAHLSDRGGAAVIVGIAMLWAGGTAIAGAFMLRRPGMGSMTLDLDGFETSGLYGNVDRIRWRDVTEFELRPFPKFGGGSFELVARADLLNAPSVPIWGMLPDNYGLTEAEIVRLMNEWRARALARPQGASRR